MFETYCKYIFFQSHCAPQNLHYKPTANVRPGWKKQVLLVWLQHAKKGTWWQHVLSTHGVLGLGIANAQCNCNFCRCRQPRWGLLSADLVLGTVASSLIYGGLFVHQLIILLIITATATTAVIMRVPVKNVKNGKPIKAIFGVASWGLLSVVVVTRQWLTFCGLAGRKMSRLNTDLAVVKKKLFSVCLACS